MQVFCLSVAFSRCLPGCVFVLLFVCLYVLLCFISMSFLFVFSWVMEVGPCLLSLCFLHSSLSSDEERITRNPNPTSTKQIPHALCEKLDVRRDMNFHCLFLMLTLSQWLYSSRSPGLLRKEGEIN